MAKKNQAPESVSLVITPIETRRATFRILGTSALICNRVSEKAKRELLFPRKKTTADRAQNLKHDPLAEYRASPYINPDPKGKTYLQHLAPAFKGAVKSAALDVPGASKAQIGRLCWVNGERLELYGVPQMLMSVVRSADMNKTPDIRTRSILPEWACTIEIEYVTPILTHQGVVDLLHSAGRTQGVFDYRVGKGSGTYGQFIIVSDNEPENVAKFNNIVKHGGRKAQEAAMKNPEMYDQETADLYGWYCEEIMRRGQSGQTEEGRRKTTVAAEAKPSRNGHKRHDAVLTGTAI